MDPLHIAVWVVVGAMVLGLAWSLCIDRPRDRLRCPKCWYTIDLPTRTECPECSRAITDQRHLNRTRRHPWRSGAFALGLTMALYCVMCVDSIRRDGWLGVVPTIVLVAITDGEYAWRWQWTTPSIPVVKVIKGRMDEHRSSLWSRRVWARKAASCMPQLSNPTWEFTTARVYDLSRFAPLTELDHGTFVSIYGPQPVMSDHRPQQVWRLIRTIQQDRALQSVGQSAITGRLFGDQLVVRTTESHHAEVVGILKVLASAPRLPGEPLDLTGTSRRLVWYELGSLRTAGIFQELAEMAGYRMLERAGSEGWLASSEGDNRIEFYHNGVLIMAPPEVHKEIAAFIDAKAATVQSSE